MTLEINEIGITMRVRSDPVLAAVTDADVPGAPASATTARDELVELCVRRVLRELRAAKER
ncbi:hypothetical protein FNL55_24275 [Tardiphaga sp. vice352]|uniref:DUF5908 family protein n=1 Tax=unclassified Tardiphaga TaxID=2631404 RepID=UPI001162A980|nr:MULTISPECIES: DUF5908 family protein [unclassified Tardiphaga]QDM18812.1 hypothetical protein FNL53_24815 [Tardiphaga sp. vice278]QDM23805.1 hypothetical protein FIU28_23585 [Tardiphaga sp. vice154]QDM29027.1 hypothetical protein FNL56_25025 [Tardiphaga sp. vice304]QDM34128.1 hypothetical protein FNL55_24275 [Tardiphaga sp. vice352]